MTAHAQKLQGGNLATDSEDLNSDSDDAGGGQASNGSRRKAAKSRPRRRKGRQEGKKPGQLLFYSPRTQKVLQRSKKKLRVFVSTVNGFPSLTNKSPEAKQAFRESGEELTEEEGPDYGEPSVTPSST